MTDMIRNGLPWMQGQLRQYASTGLTYRRGYVSEEEPGNSVTVLATSGSTSESVVVEDGVGVRRQVRDYKFAIADMVAPVTFPPIVGDQIVELDGSVWVVAQLGTESHWHWHDEPNNTAIRVHFKQESY